MINNKSNINNNLTQEMYKKKYLKYKYKYYNLQQNKFKGGGVDATLIIILVSLILGGLGVGLGYHFYSSKTEKNDMSIYNELIKRQNKFFKKLNIIINDKTNTNLYSKLYNFYKYEHISLNNYIDTSELESETNTDNMSNNKRQQIMDKLANIKKEIKANIPIFSLIKINEKDIMKDSFIYALKNSIIENKDINEKLRTLIVNKSYSIIRTELIDHIYESMRYDTYFEENTMNHYDDKINLTPDEIKMANLYNINSSNFIQENKKRFVEYMRKNENGVSDFPMIHAASNIYNIYIIVNVHLTNARYFKIYRPIETTLAPSIFNTILLNYTNYCDYNCDYMNSIKNNNINNLINNNNMNNMDNMDNISNQNINKLPKLDKTIIDSNFKWADKNKSDYLDNKNIEFYTHKLDNSNISVNNIANKNLLAHNEKKNINKELNTRPIFEYYRFNINILKKIYDQDSEKNKKLEEQKNSVNNSNKINDDEDDEDDDK